MQICLNKKLRKIYSENENFVQLDKQFSKKKTKRNEKLKQKTCGVDILGLNVVLSKFTIDMKTFCYQDIGRSDSE